MQCQGLPFENYSFYLLGTLSGPELDELQGHLGSECAQCRSELSVARRMFTGVAMAAPQIEPRRALRKRVIGSVQDPERFRVAWWQPVTALGALAIAVVAGSQIGTRQVRVPIVKVLPAVGVSVLEQENRALRERLTALASTPAAVSAPVRQAPKAPLPSPVKSDGNTELRAQIAGQSEQLSILQQELARQKQLAGEASQKLAALAAEPKPDTAETQRQLAAAQNRTQQLERDVSQYRSLLATARQRLETPGQAEALLANPNVRLVQLRGTGRGTTPQGHVLLASGSELIFFASQLPALPAGRVYQLWLIRGSAPAIVSAGVFQADSQRRATVRFDGGALTSGVTTIAVTDEPEGGSTLPTGHKLLIGS